MRTQTLALIGFGAIGRAVYQRMQGHAGVRITHIVVSEGKAAALQAELGAGVTVTHQVPHGTPLVLECAGHTALTAHVLPALQRGDAGGGVGGKRAGILGEVDGDVELGRAVEFTGGEMRNAVDHALGLADGARWRGWGGGLCTHEGVAGVFRLYLAVLGLWLGADVGGVLGLGFVLIRWLYVYLTIVLIAQLSVNLAPRVYIIRASFQPAPCRVYL